MGLGQADKWILSFKVQHYWVLSSSDFQRQMWLFRSGWLKLQEMILLHVNVCCLTPELMRVEIRFHSDEINKCSHPNSDVHLHTQTHTNPALTPPSSSVTLQPVRSILQLQKQCFQRHQSVAMSDFIRLCLKMQRTFVLWRTFFLLVWRTF